MLTTFIDKLQDRQSLQVDEMRSAMDQIMSGAVEQEQIVNFLIGLRDKGETIEEIQAAAEVMRRFSVSCVGVPEGVVDTCGTGGDNKGTFNISTVAAFVVAGAGVPVAKHGNRSISSRSGSADVLEALGAVIDLPPERVVACIKEAGIGFFFAPRYHPAMKNVAAARKQIGTRTLFNLLGPMTNPAGAKRQLIGVFSGDWCRPLAEVLGKLGSEHVMVVHGRDGMDEITLCDKTDVAEYKDGALRSWEIDPTELGLTLCDPKELMGGDAETNSHMLRGILDGFESPVRDAVLLNASAALVVAGRANDLQDGYHIASKSIDQGKAFECLKRLIEVSQR